MGSVGPWGVVFLWSWGIGKAPDNTGVLGRISRRKKDFLLRAWAMFGWCVSNPECVKLMISYESISTPKLIIPLRINVIEIVFKHQVGQIGCFLCLPATHTENLWPPLTHMFPDKTDTRWCPSSLAKLANITPITMVYGRYIYTCYGYLQHVRYLRGPRSEVSFLAHVLSYGTCSRCVGIPTGDIWGHHIHWWHNEAGPQMPVIPSI